MNGGCLTLPNSGATTIKVSRTGADGTPIIRNFEVNSQALDIASTKSSKNDVPTAGELCDATLRWFQENKPEMTKAKLVVKFDAKGWIVLFTPPYCPDLQPIELFWACGKNRARDLLDARALEESRNRSIEQTVNDLREGWYGNGSTITPCNCAGLVRTAIKKANERVGFDELLSGDVEHGLTVDPSAELTVGVDQIGRATRVLCRRAAEAELLLDPEDNGNVAALMMLDGDDDDDDSDDEGSD